jgi:hypothetical protein
MISDKNLDEIIIRLNTTVDSQDILKEQLQKRIMKIQKNLSESEEEKFKYISEKFKNDSKDIFSILEILRYLPSQVDVNRQFLVRYLWELYDEVIE